MKLCRECGKYKEHCQTMPRHIGGQGYVGIAICPTCLSEIKRESKAAMEKLRKVMAGKKDVTRRLLEEYASDTEGLSSIAIAEEIHVMYTCE